MHAVMSEWERDQISTRTKLALQAAKARGVVLGICGMNNLKSNLAKRQSDSKAFAENLSGQIEGFKLRGLSQRAMVGELNLVGIQTPKGGNWSLIQLQRTISNMQKK
jgi:DNA invertase Pin-like site-specific DNA recombinase